MSQTDNDLSLEALVGRGRLVRYAECAALARALRDGRLRPTHSHPATAAQAAFYAVEYARRRGWEPAPDLVAMAEGGTTS